MPDYLSTLTVFTWAIIVLSLMLNGRGEMLEVPCSKMATRLIFIADFRFFMSIIGYPCREHMHMFCTLLLVAVVATIGAALSAYSNAECGFFAPCQSFWYYLFSA